MGLGMMTVGDGKKDMDTSIFVLFLCKIFQKLLKFELRGVKSSDRETNIFFNLSKKVHFY